MTNEINNILTLDEFYKGDVVSFYVLNENNYQFDECNIVFAGNKIFKFQFSDFENNKIYFKLSETETSSIDDGTYKIFAIYSKTNVYKKTEEIKNITVLKNIDEITSYENVKSYNRKMLEAISNILEGRVKDDYISYTIGNRSITKMSIESLIKLRDRFQESVDYEENKKNGRNNSTKIKIRWTS